MEGQRLRKVEGQGRVWALEHMERPHPYSEGSWVASKESKQEVT